MTQDFIFPATGWRRELSDNARKQILRVLPTLPIDKISREAGWYVILRDADHPSPQEARATLHHLQKLAIKLHATLQEVGPLRSFIEQSAALIEAPIALQDFQIALLYYERAFSKTATFIPQGRRRPPRERLVRSLVSVLRDAGENIDATPQGALCRLIGIVLEDVGENPSDIPKIVRPVLRALENSGKKATAVSINLC
jgi:hypothetical protein